MTRSKSVMSVVPMVIQLVKLFRGIAGLSVLRSQGLENVFLGDPVAKKCFLGVVRITDSDGAA